MGPRRPEIEFVDLRKVQQCASMPSPSPDIAAGLQELKQLANGALKKGPFSITTDKQPPHVAASNDIHDFLSYAPYFWPSESGDGKYVRRDGKRNPDVALVTDQKQLENMAEQVYYLCLGYIAFKTEAYAQHATRLLQVFFLDPPTRMNPNVTYGQVVRGTTNPSGIGRAEGIISTRSIAQVVNVMPALQGYAGYDAIAPQLVQWFQAYVEWLLSSEIGKKEFAAQNNHATWYLVQVVMIGMTFGTDAQRAAIGRMLQQFMAADVPRHIDPKTGDQPLESARTRPYHYLVFNLQALLYLTDWARAQPQQVCDTQDALIRTAVDYLTVYDTTKTNEDITEAVPCVRIMHTRGVNNDAYKRLINAAQTSANAEKITGPKHHVCCLWS